MAVQDKKSAREGQRIAKVMARAGLCSRRDAEAWIEAGRVSVNGEVLTSPAFNVSDADDISVDGQPLGRPERTRLFLFHKPKGLVTTAKDPEGRPTIFDALPEALPRVVTIGRLDINTEGLLLLSNDGGLARVLELPSTGWLRRYRVRAHGEITQEQLDGLRDGVTIEGVNYLGIEAKFERQQGSNVWLTMGLREGKNREIKRVLEHMGLSVNRLIRVSFGPFELGDLPEREVVEVRTKVLRDQLGPKLAKQAGANFEAPQEAPALAPALAPEPPRGDLPLRRSRSEPSAGEPRKRKHVSVLRAEAREEAAGPRKRISRATVSDRKGREVQIERVSLAKKVEEAPVRERRPAARRSGEAAKRAPREGFEKRSFERPARRAPVEGFEKRDRAPREGFGEKRNFERPTRRPPGEGFEKRERTPREGFGEKHSFERPARRAPGEGFEKRERTSRVGFGEKRSFERPARRAPAKGFEKRERTPREASSEKRSVKRPTRHASGEGFEKRAPRESSGEKRDSRSRTAGGNRERTPRDGEPPRSGGNPRGGKGGPPRTPRG